MENDADMIIPNLWLGNGSAAVNNAFLIKANIRRVVNITDDIPNNRTVPLHYRVPLKDYLICKENCDIETYIENCMNFIFDGLIKKEGVLVHCKRGHHRSACIILLFLMIHLNVSLKDGISYINSIRPLALRRSTCMYKEVIKYFIKKLDVQKSP